ncbi:MAG: Crp/Fnr family transcriptional regulator [Acidobacteriota bacterium]|nr:Crp/Fnr family transcriptional regulator [Acidobacteriota bacterium]
MSALARPDSVQSSGEERQIGSSLDQKTFLAEAGEGRSLTQYSKNQIIFVQGTPGEYVFYILKGRVKLTVNSSSGKEAVVALLSTGAFLGEGCLAGQLVRRETATAVTVCSIMRLNSDAITRVISTESSFCELFMAHLLSRNIRLEEDLVDQISNPSEKRLARILLLLANVGKEGKPGLVVPKISQETLAEMVGTTRPRISFFMNKFRKLGLIDYNSGGLEVHSSLSGVVLHE